MYLMITISACNDRSTRSRQPVVFCQTWQPCANDPCLTCNQINNLPPNYLRFNPCNLLRLYALPSIACRSRSHGPMSTQTNPYARTDAKASNASTTKNAALQGAALAFAKPPVKPKPDNYSGNNGALAAATKAGGNTNARRNSPVAPPGSNGKDELLMPRYSGASNIYGSARPGTDLVVQRQKMKLVKEDISDHLLSPSAVSSRSISPSQIAASLAASRSAPITPNHTGQQSTRPPVLHRETNSSGQSPERSISRSRVMPEDAPDTTSIPPTISLIGMFEPSTGTTHTAKKPKSSIAIANSNTPAVVSPKPGRAQTILVEHNLINAPKPSLPPPRRADVGRTSRTPSRGTKTPFEEKDTGDASSEDSFVSESDQRPQSAVARKHRPTSVPASADVRKIDALANAIVASSLASSRAGSPSKSSQNLAPPLPPPRRGNNGLFAQPNTFNSRTSSPVKGLRQTMRKPPKDEEEEDQNMLRRGKKNIMKKHPNKHHEGDRKRWRDAITERERKRYEAVWASNKGLHVYNDTPSFPPPPGSENQAVTRMPPNPSQFVSNLVVRDIWSRSRLGTDVLSEVWELVDRTGTGMLSREEFVVGLWLIDQRLKGRKLPIRVGESVWSSISALGGIKVKGNGRNR